MKWAGSGSALIESPANCRPAIQPSVRCSNAKMSHALTQKIPGFVRQELQIRLADLDNLPADAQTGDRQRQIFAGDEDQTKLRGLMLDEEINQPQNNLVF